MTTAVESIIKSDIVYIKETGQLFWNKPGSGRKLNKSIGSVTKQGYLQTTVGGKQLKLHHIVWFIETGVWPKDQLDHRNKLKSDNRFSNLREGASVNQHNRSVKVGASGLSGAYWCKTKKKWRSSIRMSGKTKHLGYFNTKECANNSYLEAKRGILHG